jgi:hypothetical protein
MTNSFQENPLKAQLLKLGKARPMLQLRPNCEACDKDLPPNAADARICSYECTFCAGCVENMLHNVCPNCGGGFTPRPIRPVTEWRPGISLGRRPASIRRIYPDWQRDEVAAFVERVRHINPADR